MFCINLCRIIDPEIIVFGGGMSLAGEALLTPLRAAIKRRTWTVLPTNVVIAGVKHSGGNGGILGAALSAKMSSGRGSAGKNKPSGSVLTLHRVVTGMLSVGTASIILLAIGNGASCRQSLSANSTGVSSSHGSSSETRCSGMGQYAYLGAHILLVGLHSALLYNWKNSN